MAQNTGPLRAATLGFTVTGAFLAYQLFTDVQSPVTRNPALMLLFVILCPPSLLSQIFANVDVGTSNFYTLWTVIGILNAGLYASVRMLRVRWPKKAK
jgi:hypothetical protein